MVQDRLIVVVYKGLLSCHILITKLFSSRRPSVELDWAREKKVLDADPTMVIFVTIVYIPSFGQFCIHQTLKIQVKLYLKRMEREGIARVGIYCL